MADILAKYGTGNQTITITIASLANNGARESTAIDNTSNKFLDALVSIKVKTGAGSPAVGPVINVYAYGTADGGSNYSDSATGSDAAITLTSPPNVRLIGVINAAAAATTYKAGPFSVAAAFGGVLPDHWGIILENKEGQTLDATGGSHSAVYQGVAAQTV